MALIEVPSDNPGGGLRTGVPDRTFDGIEQRAADQHRQNEQIAMGVLFAAVMIAALAVAHIIRNRRKIARAADAAVVAGLATGVRAGRAAASKRDALVARVMAKADEKPSAPD